MTGPKRAGVYARISEHDERVAKVENQIADCGRHAKSRGYEVVDRFTDDGISATTGRERPGFERLIHEVEARRLDVIVAVDEDRMSRDLADTMRLQMTCAASGVTWDTVRGGVRDPGTADGKFFTSLKALVSRMEVDKKVERQKAANMHRRLAGMPLSGTRPFGFEKNRLTHRPDEVEELRWAYKTVIGSGGKLYPILKSWNERGVLTTRGNKWSYATLQQILKRASNAGLVEAHGEILEGVLAVWEPLVSRSDWETVCGILSDPNRRIAKSREPVHLLAGLISCGTCGSVMRSSGSTNKPGERIYRCATKINAQGDHRRHVSIRTEEADPVVRNAVLIALLQRGFTQRTGDMLPDLYACKAALQARHGELADLVADGTLTAPEARPKLIKLRQELDDVTGRIQAEVSDSPGRRLIVQVLRDLVVQEPHPDLARFLRRPQPDPNTLFPLRIESPDKLAPALVPYWNELTLTERRLLVRDLVEVTVKAGRGTERIEIRPLTAARVEANVGSLGTPRRDLGATGRGSRRPDLAAHVAPV